MKKRSFAVVAVLVILALFATDVVYAAAPLPPLGRAFDTLEDFLQQGYLRYTRTIDFILTFLLVTVVVLLGAEKVFGDQKRQAKSLAIVVGLISAYALVMGAGFSWLGLPLLWKFLFGWIALTLLFIYMGAKKGWAAVLALLIMLLLFFLGGLFDTGSPGSWFGSITGTPSGSSVSQPGDKLSGEECQVEGVFEFDSSNAAAFRPSIEKLVNSCSGKLTVFSYTSAEGKYEYNNNKLAPERAKAVEDIVMAIKSDARVLTVPKGPTWDFTAKGNNDWAALERDEKNEIINICKGKPHSDVLGYEEYLAPNRRFILRCNDCDGTEPQTEDVGKTPETCQEVVSEIQSGTFTGILDWVGLKDKEKELDAKLKEYESQIQACKKKLNKEDLTSLQTYYDILRLYNMRLGTRWVELGHWGRGKPYFEEILTEVKAFDPDHYDKVGVVVDAFNTWTYLLDSRYFKMKETEIVGSTVLTEDEKVKELDGLIAEVDDAQQARKDFKFYEPKKAPPPVDSSSSSSSGSSNSNTYSGPDPNGPSYPYTEPPTIQQ